MKLAILTPCMTSYVSAAFCASLADTLRRVQKAEVVWMTITGTSILHMARNQLVARALAWGADKMVFLDDDVSWEPEDFQKLVSAPEPIVAGVYEKKRRDMRAPLSFAVSALPEGFKPDHRGLIEVHGAATGFLRLDASVMHALKPHCVKVRDESLDAAANEHMHLWFDFPPTQREGGVYVMGEDYSLCQRARAAGFRVWIDPTIKLRHHVGGFVFDARLPDMNLL